MAQAVGGIARVDQSVLAKLGEQSAPYLPRASMSETVLAARFDGNCSIPMATTVTLSLSWFVPRAVSVWLGSGVALRPRGVVVSADPGSGNFAQ